jgi:hypothetical protein
MSDRKVICPLIRAECIKDAGIVDGEICKCAFWVTITGKDPSTGEMTNRGECSWSWVPILLIENSKMQYQTGAAIESFRNEMVAGNAQSKKLLGG